MARNERGEMRGEGREEKEEKRKRTILRNVGDSLQDIFVILSGIGGGGAKKGAEELERVWGRQLLLILR